MGSDDRELIRKLNLSEEEEEEPQGRSLVEVEREMANELAPDSMFRFLNMPTHRLETLQLTKNQANRLLSHVRALRTGSCATVPLICGGLRCPFVTHCPLTEYNIDGEIDTAIEYPILEQCPVETGVIRLKVMDLAREYSVDPEDITDLAILTKIAELDIYDHRLGMNLAKDEAQSLMRTEVTHIDEDGNTYETLKIHPALEAKERIVRMRDTLVRAMLGTRREQAKVASGEDGKSDLVREMTKLRSELTRLKEAEMTIEGKVESDNGE
jgi:hypothetical protein